MPSPRPLQRRSVLRSEDEGLLSGRTRFLEDVVCEGSLHAIFVRSILAHARIVSVDVSQAAALPGVTGVFTAPDFPGMQMPTVEDFPDGLGRPLLASDIVRFTGEPVAVVVASTRALAMDAAELVVTDYDPLPVLADPGRAQEAGAPLLFPDHGTNIALVYRLLSHADALGDADVIVRSRFVNQRLIPSPLEVNGALAVPENGGLTLWLSCQSTHTSRAAIAKSIGIDERSLRVRTAAVGGGFGARIPAYPEQAVVAALALRLGSPVRYVEGRSENCSAMTHGRDHRQDVELGAKRDGRIVGLRVRSVADLGAYVDEGATLPELTAMMAVGPYDIPRLDLEIRAVFTNKTPLGAYRGAGRPEATALIERAVDLLALQLGMDPAQVRRINFIDRFPCRTVTGATYDTGAYGAALDEALRVADYDVLRQEQVQRRGRGDHALLGIGIGSYVEVTGWGSEYARVLVEPDGTIELITGTSPQGQGHETAFAQIVADRLGVPFERVVVRHSDTAIVPRSEGTMGSRSLQVGGSAVLEAADELVERGRALAAQAMEVEEADLVLSDQGRFEIVGAERAGISWAELARVADPEADGAMRLDVEHDFEIPSSTFPFGTHVAVVEVDAETGEATLIRHVAVDDCGAVLNPMLVEGQVHGGIAQGVAQALFEGAVYDDTGTLMTSSFATYAVPSAAELPSFETRTIETSTSLNPLGAKGIGESGTIGAMPAVQNAVVDALSQLGVRHLDPPATPERVWRAIAASDHAAPSEPADGSRRNERAERPEGTGGREPGPAIHVVVIGPDEGGHSDDGGPSAR